MKVNDETITFNILKAMDHSRDNEGCNHIEILDSRIEEMVEYEVPTLPREKVMHSPHDIVKISEYPRVRDV